MAAPLIVRALDVPDAGALFALRREALESDPLAFGSAADDDRFRVVDAVRAALADHHERAIFGCLDGVELAGMVGVMRESRMKLRHKAGIWGMYVSPRTRGHGAGRRLLDAAVERARSWAGVVTVHLSVAEAATEAYGLYTSAGFREWGREPRALLWEGRYVDHVHMALDLDTSAAGPR